MIDVTTNGANFPADGLTVRRDDGGAAIEGSVTWHGGPYALSDVGETLTVDAGAGGKWPGVDGAVSAAAESYEGHVFAVNRDRRGSLTAHWRRLNDQGNHQRLQKIWDTIAEGKFFDNWTSNPWWAHLAELGVEHGAPDGVNGIYHLMGSRWGPDTQYSQAIAILSNFGVGVREGDAGLELIDLLAPDNPTHQGAAGYVDLAAGLIEGLPEEAVGDAPYNRAGGYLSREIKVPAVLPAKGTHAEYSIGGSSVPPLYVRATNRSLASAKVEEQLQRNQLRLSATRITVKMSCGWWGIEPGQGFRLPAALDPVARRWRTESVAMSMSGGALSTTLHGRLHQPTNFW